MKIKECREHLRLVQDSLEVEMINGYFGQDYDGYLIDTLGGQIIEAHGFYGNVPYLDKVCYKVC